MDLPEEFDWPARTREWWAVWSESPQAPAFSPQDWQFLLDTALIHAAFWHGDTRVAGELRSRTAKIEAMEPVKKGATTFDDLASRRRDRISKAAGN